MKIRLRGNNIRYRLDQADVQKIRERGKVEEHTWIGANTLHFCIRGKEADAPHIKLEGFGVHLSVPYATLEPWTESNQVGFNFDHINPDGSILHVLVEKDFKCLTERDEDESKAFDNPLAKHNC